MMNELANVQRIARSAKPQAAVGRFLRILVLAIGAWTLLAPAAARADALDDVQRRGVLRWGADAEGGGPYVYPDEKNPSIIKGFEVELADMLAEELHVKAEFKQGQWENLPNLLDNGGIDIVLNGYELTPTRQEHYLCSQPYYVYGLQLLVRRDSKIRDWTPLLNPVGAKIRAGALGNSAAETYLKNCKNVEVINYDTVTGAMAKVADGDLDATLQDDPIAIFYSDQYPSLRRVGRLVGEGYYVALIKKDSPKLCDAINTAIDHLIADGRLKKLYDRWDLSGKAQMLALGDTRFEAPQATYHSLWDVLSDNLPILLQAAGMTVVLSFAAMPLAILIGILVAVGRMYGPWPLEKLLAAYVEFLRGTPLMLQLFAIFYLLPKVGISVPPLVAAITGLAINYSAYEAEIYRAGLQAIPRGQMEAALSLGMSPLLAIRRIILPQAFRIVIPPVTNDFIALFKDTSVCSVVTVIELTKQYSILAQSTGQFLQLAIITSVLYLLMSYPLSLFARWSERRLAEGGQAACRRVTS